MRRLELVEGVSNKFWEIEVSDNDVTTRWGRVGTAGQSKTKTFASPAAAQKEHDDLVREKLAKGYHEVGAGPSAPPPARPENGEAIARGNLGRKAHPFRSLGLKRLDIDVAKVFGRMREHYRQHADIWARVGTEDAAMAPVLARVRKKLTNSSPALGTTEEETEIAAVLGFCKWGVDSVDDDVIDRWVALGGMRFAVRTMIAAQGLVAKTPAHLERTSEPENFVRGELGPLYRLRRHLASAPEQEWTDAREIARNARTGAPLSLRVLIAYLFPEVAEWANEDATQVLKRGSRKLWAGALLMTGLDVALATRLIDGMTSPFLEIPNNPAYRGSEVEGAAHSMVAAHGLRAIPALLKLFDKASDLCGREGVATALALLPSDEALGVLASRLDLLLPAVTEAAHRFPRRAIPILAAFAGRGESRAETILTDVMAANGALVDEILPTLWNGARAVVEKIRAKSAPLPDEASLADLPRVLARPPWNEKGKAVAESKPLELAMLEVPVEVIWPGAWRDEYSRISRFAPHPPVYSIWREASSLDDAALRARIREAALTDTEGYRYVYGRGLVEMPERLALAVWDVIPIDRLVDPEPFLAKFEARAFPVLLRYVAATPGKWLEMLVPFGSPAAAPVMADALAKLKTARPLARQWLLLHPEAAAIGLIPQAAGPRGAERNNAAGALRFLIANGHEELVMAAAARYGAEAVVAVREVLDSDPLLYLPRKLPALPRFWRWGAFTRPRLRRNGAALPAGAMDALATMLAFSSLEEPYAGIADVKEACEPSSLGAFAWDVFSAWLAAGAPSKEAWALNALGHLGDDACARKLAPLIREWPGQTAHARAVAGLDVLAAIGSDVALMHLHGIAQKVKFKGLQERAREKMQELAVRRGLTAEELADRLVPDLGLEDDGSMTLDFGPRSFRVGFDEYLRPYVKDAEGKKLPDLPKPGKSDDAGKGQEATERWKVLKKDAKTLAGQQIFRLEMAMCSRRRFDVEVFRQFFVEHPLVQHLVRRVVWGAYDDKNRLLSTFRVSEDHTFADANDDAYRFPEGARVGVVHAYELKDAVAAAWGQLFGDYEILQPWQQLGREVYRPTRGERAAKVLTRWTDVTVPVGKVLGLEQRGWRRGPAGTGGVATWYFKPLPPEHEIRLELEPGIDAGGALGSDEQTLGEVTITERAGDWQSVGIMTFGELDPVAFSELVRDLEALAS
jgi:predicted DNA-binding WGR domain protein